jgi:peptidoglycan/xylan/chitin deacetylase (PgdA/CDA1 family)
VPIALTYDDGPDPIWTPRLLAELDLRGARATFFVEAGRAVSNPGLVEAIVAAGHEVGFHCCDHRRHSEMSEEEIEADAVEGLRLLEAIGVRPTTWRPPWGAVTSTTWRVAADHDLEICGWNVDSHDWRGDSCEDMLTAIAAVGGIRDGSVVLMHDGIGPGARRDGCEQTLALTAALLERADEAGLRTATFSAQRRLGAVSAVAS